MVVMEGIRNILCLFLLPIVIGPAILGYCLGRWTPLYIRIIPLPFILRLSMLWISTPGHLLEIYATGSWVYAYFCYRGLKRRAEDRDVGFWKVSPFDWLAVVIAIILTLVVAMCQESPWSARPKALNNRQMMDYRHAMNQYHDSYGRFPMHCTNVTELVRVLGGENINADNPDNIRFFASEMPLKKRVLDGYGYPFDLLVDTVNTNFILQSYGSKQSRKLGLKTSNPLLRYPISTLYTQTLAEAEAEARAWVQCVHVSGTNQLNQAKETNHVDSISQ